jgi:RNA chaperone Hfq
VNGIKLTGKLKQFDQYTLLLQDADGIDSLIFKHAISTLIPGAPG